jgi:hypothetical protein
MIYISSGFSHSDIYIIIKISDEINNMYKCDTIIIDDIDRFNLNYENFKSKIIFIGEVKKKYNYINVLKSFRKFSPLSFAKFKIPNKSINFEENSFFHSVWDITRLSNKKQLNNFIFKFHLILNYLRCIKFYSKMNIFYHKNDFKISFFSHIVYYNKISYNIFNTNKSKAFYIVNFSIGRLNSFKNSWIINLYNDYNLISDLVNINYTKFWINRLRGNGFYEDAARSFSIDNATKVNNLHNNIIFLHIFDDSPFIDIDASRIFIDYYKWFIETLKIINKSSEIWYIKVHPSSKRWGENQLDIIKPLINTYCKRLYNSNKLFIIESTINNEILINQATRILTFGGTIIYESIALGKKPIAISNLMNDDNLTIKNSLSKPNNLMEYRDFLLNKYDPIIRNNDDIENAKKILFIREDLFNFGKYFKLGYLYRNDDDIEKNLVFKKSVINSNINSIRLIAKNIIDKDPIINPEFLI